MDDISRADFHRTDKRLAALCTDLLYQSNPNRSLKLESTKFVFTYTRTQIDGGAWSPRKALLFISQIRRQKSVYIFPQSTTVFFPTSL
jgi:hypothetical protein